jgi:phosphopantetheine adenylyltransferase
MLSHVPKSTHQGASNLLSVTGNVDAYLKQKDGVPSKTTRDDSLSNDLHEMETDEENSYKINTHGVDDLSDDEVIMLDKEANNGCSDYLCIECNHGFRTEKELQNHECNNHEMINNSVSKYQDHNKCKDKPRSKENMTNPYGESTQVDSKHYSVYNEETVTESVTCGACRAIFSVSKGLENHLKLYPDHKL